MIMWNIEHFFFIRAGTPLLNCQADTQPTLRYTLGRRLYVCHHAFSGSGLGLLGLGGQHGGKHIAWERHCCDVTLEAKSASVV